MDDTKTKVSKPSEENADVLMTNDPSEENAQAQETPVRSKDDLQRELADRKARFEHTPMTMTPDLEKLLASEIREDKKEKKRAAQMLGVLAKHNFYANGLTPEELRTTLEDLGPT